MDRLGGLAPIKWFSLPSGRRKPGFAPRRYRAAPEFLRRVRGGTTTAPTRRSHTTVRRAPRPRREFVSPLRRCPWRCPEAHPCPHNAEQRPWKAVRRLCDRSCVDVYQAAGQHGKGIVRRRPVQAFYLRSFEAGLPQRAFQLNEVISDERGACRPFGPKYRGQRAAAQRHLALQRTERVEIEIDPYRPAMVLLVMAARIAFDAQLHEVDAAVAADWQFDGISLFGGRLCNGAEQMKLDARQRGGGEALQGTAVVLRPVERRQQAQEIGLEIGTDFSAARACEFLYPHQARIAQRLPQAGRRQRSGRKLSEKPGKRSERGRRQLGKRRLVTRERGEGCEDLAQRRLVGQGCA